MPLPSQAQAVVIGGGVVGCSVAYHLAQRGWTDTILLERDVLTSGTTWHAAGLVTQLRGTFNLTRLSRYTAELFRDLERTSGHGTGYVQHGSLTIATNQERFTEIRRAASMAHYCDVEAEVLSAAETVRLWPFMDPTGVVGAVHLPGDGQANPTDVTQALAAAARSMGVQIREHLPVTDVRFHNGRVAGVETAEGTVTAPVVINCTGMWARTLGLRSGVAVPLHAAEHFYIVTEPVPDLPDDLPILRSLDEWAYVKGDAGKLLAGFFEPGAKPWATHGIPDGASFTRLREDWDHLGPYVAGIAERVPILRDIGIQLHFNGPESFTPDDRYILGEAPGVDGYFVAAGFNSVGFLSSGGAGRVLADWIVDGHPPMDLWDVDVRRFTAVQNNRRYLEHRTTEVLGLLYDMHWPFRQFETSRGVRRTPFHDRLAGQGACFGETAGWERANWYGKPGETPRYTYGYGRPDWFARSAEEHQAVREGVGLFDQSSFGKILVQGRDALGHLQRLSTADLDVDPDRIVYTQWLDERGGIEADLTITRLAEDRFLVVTAAATVGRELDHLRRTRPSDGFVVIDDVSNQDAVLGIMGPRSRELLASLTDQDLGDAAFPFGTSRQIDLGMAFVRAARITYVGELGWELYIPADVTSHVYDAIVAVGAPFGLRHCGYHAMDSLRLEKAYRHWGHDVTTDDTTLEAGLTFTHAWDKPGGFVGRVALLRQREAGVRRRLVTFTLDDPAPVLHHGEPILRDGRIAGRVTSGWYGHTLERAVGMGYVSDPDGGPVDAAFVRAGTYEVEIATERHAVTPWLRAPYDPEGLRIRG